jgi:hypothetical protein
MLERIERDYLVACELRLPVGLAEKQALRRNGMIKRRAEGLALERLCAGIVMVGNLLEPLRPRVVDERIEADDRTRQIVEQSLEPVVEQRQPMLHALVLAPRRDRLVKRVLARHRAEQLHIALAEVATHLGRQRHLAHRQKLYLLAPRLGALRFRLEGPDRFEGVTEEVEAHRLTARRKEIEDAAAHGVLAGIDHRAGAPIARRFQPDDQILH